METPNSESETYAEIAELRVTGAILVYGRAQDVVQYFKEAHHRPELRVIYQRTTGRHLRIVEEGERL